MHLRDTIRGPHSIHNAIRQSVGLEKPLLTLALTDKSVERMFWSITPYSTGLILESVKDHVTLKT